MATWSISSSRTLRGPGLYNSISSYQKDFKKKGKNPSGLSIKTISYQKDFKKKLDNPLGSWDNRVSKKVGFQWVRKYTQTVNHGYLR
jgi:hypothetical protein